MRGLLRILSLFCNEFNKFMIQEHDFRFYLSYEVKITLKSHFGRKERYNIVIVYATLLWTS